MPELDVAFINDAPVALAADGKGSWVQIAKQGRFDDPRYGKFSITQDDFDRWTANFAALSVANGRAGLPIDVDHGPEKRGDTEAAGWITKLEQRGDELWGLAEWNDLGKQLVGERRYLYLSPSYQHNYKDETGKAHGTALVGVGLTNRPFLRMATVSLSAAPMFAEQVTVPAHDTVMLRDFNAAQRKAAAKAGTAMPDGSFPIENEEDLHNAVRLVGRASDPKAAKAHIIARAKAMGATGALPADWGMQASADSRGATMPLPKHILSKLGLGEDATDDAAAAAVDKLLARPESQKTLDQLAGDAGKVVLDATEYAKTVADATAGAAAAKTLHDLAFETAFDKALTDAKGPRVTPAQKDGLKALYDSNADATLAAIAAMPNLGIKVEAEGSRGDAPTALDAAVKRDAGDQPVDDERAELHARVLQIAGEKNLSYEAALDVALAEV